MTDMSLKIKRTEDDVIDIKRQSAWGITFHRLLKDKAAMTGLIIIVLFALLGIFAELYCHHSATTVNPLDAFIPPCWEHLFGTDNLGRDMFARCMVGARYSLFMGFSAEITGMFIGVVLGGIAGYLGGKVDNIVMRICDIFQSIPRVLLTIAIATALGPGYVTTIFALAVSEIPIAMRIMRAQILKIREMEYVEAARAITLPRWKILARYVIPNGWAPVITKTTMGIGGMIMEAAGLSYLGLGVQPPTPEWGALLSAAKSQMRYNPYLGIFPGLMIVIVTIAFNLFGEGFRDASDPNMRSKGK